MSSDRLLRLVVPLALFLGTAALLFWALGSPDRIYFDETYYVEDAQYYLRTGVEESFAVHPPVGKWLIAAGIALVGDDPFGWRAAGALAGALTVLLVHRIGMRLFRRAGPAALAALLLATDGLFFVQARIAMLDIFLALFVALAAWLLLVDHDRTTPRGYPVPAGGSGDEATGRVSVLPPEEAEEPDAPVVVAFPPRRHGYRALAGVALGLAVAVKWSGLLALGAAGLLAIGWELAARRRVTGRWFAAWRRGVGSILVGLVLVPAAVYAASYVPWLVNYEHTSEGDEVCADAAAGDAACPVGLPGRLAGLARYHQAVWRFHVELEVDHPYRAPAYTWPILARPIVYYWETCTEDRFNRVPETDEETGEVTVPEPCVVERGQAAEILAVGNPALWWGFLGAVVPLTAGVVQRDRRAAVVFVFWAAQFLPWLLVARPAFLFYMTPTVAFVALGVAYAAVYLDERRPLVGPALGALAGAGVGLGAGFAIERLTIANDDAWWIALAVGLVLGAAVGGWRTRHRIAVGPASRRGSWAGVVVALLAVGLFVYFLPVWTGIPMAEEAVRQRWWFPGWI